MNDTAPVVQMIPIDQINVLNPRSRNKVAFQGMVTNISNLGLKRPITVARRSEPSDGKPYDLVCGQGRLEAFIALGQTYWAPVKPKVGVQVDEQLTKALDILKGKPA